MALNAVLILAPNAGWGRSYMDHLLALKGDLTAPAAVRQACLVLLETPLPGGELVELRTSNAEAKVIEAARDVVAHAYAIVKPAAG
jgi:hypothetical protein